MKVNKIVIALSNISVFRSELMGVGIIGVLFNHFIGLAGIQGPSVIIFCVLWHMVYTQGFLFLSGFGTFYSFNREHDILKFYKKRLSRLIIPFMLMSSPFFIINAITYHHSLIHFVGNITSLTFWFRGNYCGMWYIAISILMYALLPLFYNFIMGGGQNRENNNISVYCRFDLYYCLLSF